MDQLLTFFTGSVAGGIVVWLAIKLFEHRLAKDLSASDRKVNAAIEFRTKINGLMATLPDHSKRWHSNNQTISAIANFIQITDLAVNNFATFLSQSNRGRFTQKWKQTKEHCNGELPRALNSGDQERANTAKIVFIKHVHDLLSFADET